MSKLDATLRRSFDSCTNWRNNAPLGSVLDLRQLRFRKPAPRDVDVILILAEAFRVEDTPREARTLFSHADAEARFGASIFWIREGSLAPAEIAEFLETWQIDRDGHRRRLLEIVDDRQ